MDDDPRRQRDTSLAGFEALIRRGRQLRDTPAPETTRAWQQDCAAAIHQLSGGSKAHWLSRAYSDAFLVRPARGGVVVEVDAAEILDRILEVLARGVASLSDMDDVAGSSTAAAPRPRRFEFVRAADLRPVLERTFDDSRDALERGDFGLALVLSSGILEAVITDALEASREQAPSAPEGRVTDWPFEKRIAVAESAGLIRGGCARLPAVARRYRELTDADGELRPDTGVSEREARLVRQVLHVVMRDLDPGR
jgi:hypothetical protein